MKWELVVEEGPCTQRQNKDFNSLFFNRVIKVKLNCLKKLVIETSLNGFHCALAIIVVILDRLFIGLRKYNLKM